MKLMMTAMTAVEFNIDGKKETKNVRMCFDPHDVNRFVEAPDRDNVTLVFFKDGSKFAVLNDYESFAKDLHNASRE